MSQLESVDVFDDSSETEDLNAPPTKRRRGAAQIWHFKRVHDSASAAKEALQVLGKWSQDYSNTTSEGKKTVYRCNVASRRPSGAPTCGAKRMLHYHTTSSKVSLYRNDTNHAHTENVQRRGICQETKKAICELYQAGVRKPKALLAALETRGCDIPRKKALENHLTTLRQKLYGPSSISFGELEEWCIGHSHIPDNDDMAFVAAHSINESVNIDEQQLRIFITTPLLLRFARLSNSLHADATYKLTWHGFPVLMVGIADSDNKFHPVGMAVCSSEKEADFAFIFRGLKEAVETVSPTLGEYKTTHLIADASQAITKAFSAIVGQHFTRIMCWFHVVKNCEARLKGLTKAERESVKKDMFTLHVCMSSEHFDVSSQLFVNKWLAHASADVRSFANYFREQWLQDYRLWYEGAALGFPSTNNGLESTNRVLKDSATFRERLPLSQFLAVATATMEQWSKERRTGSVNEKAFSAKPTKSLKIWTKAFQWALAAVPICADKSQSPIRRYYIQPTNGAALSQVAVDAYNQQDTTCNWISADEYDHFRYLIWVVTIDITDWESSTCTCPIFLKDLICKHSLGIAIRTKLVRAPPAARNIPIGQKRKRGRPSLATAALRRD